MNGELKILNLTKRIQDILQITRLFTVFDVQSDEDEAVRSLHGTLFLSSSLIARLWTGVRVCARIPPLMRSCNPRGVQVPCTAGFFVLPAGVTSS